MTKLFLPFSLLSLVGLLPVIARVNDYCDEATKTSYQKPYEISDVKTKIEIWVGPVMDGDDPIEMIFFEDETGWQGYYFKGEYHLRIYLEKYSWEQWFEHLVSSGVFNLKGGSDLVFSTCEIDGNYYEPIGYHYGTCVQYKYKDKIGAFYYILPAHCDFAKHCPEFEHACKMRRIFTFLHDSTYVVVDDQKKKMNEVGYQD